MKHFTITLTTVLLLLSCNKENPEDLFFDESFPSTFTDLSGEIYEISKIDNATENSLALIGYTEIGPAQFSTYDAALVETAAFLFGGNFDIEPYDLAPVFGGGLVVAGKEDEGNNEKDQGVLTAMDADQQMVWYQTYGGDQEDLVSVVNQAPNGGYFFLMETRPDYQVTSPVSLQLVRTDEAGTPLNQVNIDLDDSNRGADLLPTADGGCLVLVQTIPSNSFFNGLLALRFDADLMLEWSFSFVANDADLGWGVTQVLEALDGGFLVMWALGDPAQPGTSSDLHLTKIDASGQLEWQQNYGLMDAFDYGRAVVMTSDGSYLVQGFVADSRLNADDGGLLLMKVDATGNLLWRNRYGDQNDLTHSPRGIIAIENDQFIMAGNSLNLNNPPGERYFPWLMKVDADGVPID